MTSEEIETQKINKKLRATKITAAFVCVAMTAVGVVAGFSIGYTRIPAEQRQFLSFYNTFKNNYYTNVDDRTLLDGMYYGLTDSVNDDFTFYTSAANNESQSLSTSGVGLGISRAVYYGNVLLKQVMKNSPASKCLIRNEDDSETGEVGLKVDDIITMVKNEDDADYYVFRDHSYSEWGNAFTGQEGTKIEIVFERTTDGITKTYHTTITRGGYTQDKVILNDYDIESAYKEAYFTVTSFLGSGSEATPAEELTSYFKNYIFKSNDHLDNLILDLRDNGGGYVSNFQTLLGMFTEDASTAGYYLRSDGTYEELKTPKDGVNYDDKISHYTVIVNENTASAAESFIIGLQDSCGDKVKVVGEISYGKGIAQTFASVFDDGSLIRYTFARVTSPDKRCINKRGIVPDVLADYKSIQDDDNYYFWRHYVSGVSDNASLSSKDKAAVKTRIETLSGAEYETLEDAVIAYQKSVNIEVKDGTFNEETADSLADDFFDYYHDYTPSNIYTSFVTGSNDYDNYNAAQLRVVKNQINLILGTEYTSFYKAVGAFQEAYGLTGKENLYDLETSYLLEGKMYDMRMEKENSVLELAKEHYGA